MALASIAKIQSAPADAREAGLRYARDTEPGVSRRLRGSGFVYRDANGRPVDRATRARITSLVIPPAWTDVWIAADARAHLQATGRDARGRKQHRYHARWSAVRDAAKYDHVRAFGRALPLIRRKVTADLQKRPLSRQWLLATVIRLLETSVIRIGNDEYRRANGSYGLTTLLEKHAKIRGTTLTLTFRAKSGVEQVIEIRDALIVRRVRRCQELPGQTLFQYLDESGAVRPIGSSDVNAYLHDVAGNGFTAKDFRTWVGTLEAARALDSEAARAAESVTARQREIVRAIDEVSHRLGNTRAVCRKCYVHPLVLERYLDGQTISTVAGGGRGPAELTVDERSLLAVLDHRSARARCA